MIVNRRKPRVLLLNLEGMGIGASGLLAAEALSRNPDLEVRLIYDRRTADSALQKSRLAKVPSLGINAHGKWNLPLAYLQILWCCLKFRPDVVHDLSGSAFRKLLPLWPILATTSRLVFSEHCPGDGRSDTFAQRLARRTAYRLGNKFIVFGPKSRADLEMCGVSKHRIFQSTLGHKGFYGEGMNHQPARDPNVILFFGEFRPAKGIDRLPAIADAVCARWPKARFVVAGSSHVARYCGEDWQRKLDATLAEMRARPCFEVRDEVIPDEEVAAYFRRAGMVLLPYHDANQSGILMAAMALDCPVVATGVGDLPALIRNGENGTLTPNDTTALADAIVHLLENPDRASQLAAHARAEVESSLSWEQVVREYPQHAYGFAPD